MTLNNRPREEPPHEELSADEARALEEAYRRLTGRAGPSAEASRGSRR